MVGLSQVLIIYDEEVEYTSGLLECLRRSKKLRMNVSIFTERKKLQEYLCRNKVQVLLIHCSFPLEEIKDLPIEKICILYEDEYEQVDSTYPIIYKYQSAKKIVDQLINHFPSLVAITSKGTMESKTKLISVFSLDHKKEQSKFAYQLATYLSKKKKILYINLHSWQLISYEYGLMNNQGISHLIYYLRQKASNLILKMNPLINTKDELDYIIGTSYGMDIGDISPEDIKMWIEQLLLWNEYEIIIFDVGNLYSFVMELLCECKIIYYTIMDERDKQEIELMKKQLEYIGKGELLEVMTEVNLKKDGPGVIETLIKDIGYGG